MSLKKRVHQIERKSGGGPEANHVSVIFLCEMGGSGGRDEAACAKLLVGPHAGEDITKTNRETFMEFEERVERLLHPNGRTDTQRASDVTVTIGGQ